MYSLGWAGLGGMERRGVVTVSATALCSDGTAATPTGVPTYMLNHGRYATTNSERGGGEGTADGLALWLIPAWEGGKPSPPYYARVFFLIPIKEGKEARDRGEGGRRDLAENASSSSSGQRDIRSIQICVVAETQLVCRAPLDI